MNQYDNLKTVYLKPTCSECREPLTRPILKIGALAVCPQCFNGNIHFWQNYIEHKRVTTDKLILRGGLLHSYKQST